MSVRRVSWRFVLAENAKLLGMATRKRPPANNHLQEAIALLINNQAAFVQQIARNDQERLTLERSSDEWQRRSDEWQRRSNEWQRKSDDRFARIEEWQRKSDERFTRIEAELRDLPAKIIQAVFDQLPRIKKEIGFKTSR